MVNVKKQKLNKLYQIMASVQDAEEGKAEQDLNALKQLVLKHLDVSAYPDHRADREEIARRLEAGAPLTGNPESGNNSAQSIWRFLDAPIFPTISRNRLRSFIGSWTRSGPAG